MKHMRNLRIFLVALFANLQLAYAQQEEQISTLPPAHTEYPRDIATYVNSIYQANIARIPDRETLRNMPLNTNLPTTLTDTLLKYDWLNVATYSFHPAGDKYENTGEISYQYYRHNTSKGVLAFKFYPIFKGAPGLNYTQEWTSAHIIQRKGTHFYFTDKDQSREPAYFPVVDYRNGMLIVDITTQGRLNDFSTSNRYRHVWLAVPKTFRVDLQSNNNISTNLPTPSGGGTDGIPALGKRYSNEIAGKVVNFYNANKGRIPTLQALRDMPLNPNLPATLAQDLYQYDWLQVCHYDFGISPDGYTLDEGILKLQRESTTKGVLVFSCRVSGAPSLEYLDNNMNFPKAIKKKSGQSYYCLQQDMADSYMDYPVVDYKNGFLVIDFSTGEVGKLNDPQRNRVVFMAIPRYFDAITGQSLSAKIPNINPTVDNNVNSTNHDNISYKRWEVLQGEGANKITAFYEANKHKIPQEQTIKNMPINSNLPTDIGKLLYEYDFLQVADYAFNPDPAETGYKIAQSQLNIERHYKTKGKSTFALFDKIRELKFVENYPSTTYTILKRGAYFYYTDANGTIESEHCPVVDYKDGFLIIDMTFSGKINDLSNPLRFRNVYMLVPKYF